MAAVSAPQASGGALTPPASSHASSHGTTNWDYSVPTASQNRTNSFKDQRDDTQDRRPMASVTNGGQRSKPNRSNSYEPSHPPTSRVNTLSKTAGSTNSPADSVVDLYSGGRSANASTANSIDYSNRKRNSMGVYEAEIDEDDPGWIHRDKLARIESRELQAAGIVLPKTRAYSRQGGRSNRSRETSANGLGGRGRDAQKRQKMDVPEEVDDGVERDYGNNTTIDNGDNGDNTTWDLRTPEEIGQDSYMRQRELDYKNLSKGASKIPINMQSAIPVPLDFIERDAPVKRSKSAVWGKDSESIEYPHSYTKAASEEPAAPPLQQPSKTTVAKPPSPNKNGKPIRKTSAPMGKTPPVSKTRPKTRSGSTSSRPVTRSGEIKRPEGDPPWLATMYKPDPRLPPDQQLLPTVAKRMMQERLEAEGKGGSIYDTQFRPMNQEEWMRQELPSKSPSPKPEENEVTEVPLKDGDGNEGSWPLKNPNLSPTTGGHDGRPGTSGGYSTMPRISTVPPIAQMQSPPLQQKPFVKVPVMEMEEEKKKKGGGCGCCLVM